MQERRSFTAAVKDREGDQPCFIVLEDLDIDGRHVLIHLRQGTGPQEARALAKSLNDHAVNVILAGP